MRKVLFVCLGNICRSPAAEGIFNKFAEREGLSQFFEADSAGTSAYHMGEPSDPRMQQHAELRGYELTSLSRQFIAPDFEEFDLIIAMDDANLENIKSRAKKPHHLKKVVKMTDYCKVHQVNSVPDPYFGGEDGFRLVMDILEDSCGELIQALRGENRISPRP